MLSGSSTSGANIAVGTGSIVMVSTFYSELVQALFDLRWLVLFIVLLVFTDFWSGLCASVKVRGEDFRISRALRRTVAKFLEYVSYIVFGMVLSKAILMPFGIGNNTTGGALGGILALLIEADSIYGHICDLHGIKDRVSVKRMIVAYLKRKDADVGGAVEDGMRGGDGGGDGVDGGG